jgi:anti-anti-sigma regulatory factor
VCALDGLLAALVADSVTGGRHDSNRELVSQGVTNMLVSGFGALPVTGNSHAPLANHLNGGRTRLSTLLHGLFLLGVLFGFGWVIAGVPVAALAGVMVYIGLRLIDGWTRDLVRRGAARAESRGDAMLTFTVVLIVTVSMVLANVMVAIGLGVAGAVVLLLAKLSGSPVRRSFDGTAMTSLKVRDPAAASLLRANAHCMRVIELQGELFFGTTDRLQAEVDALDRATRFVVLDFRRVHQVDSSGARTLEVMSRRAERNGVRVLLSHMREDEPRGRYLQALGIAEAIPVERWFADLDHALEWAENRILEEAGYREPDDEIDLAATTLFAGLDALEVQTLRAALDRFELAEGDKVFLEGDAGDRMYVLTRGTVEIRMRFDAKGGRRLTAFNPGVPFGEMGLLEGKRRSADAYAVGERVVLYTLDAARFDQLVGDHPDLGFKIYRNLGRHLAWRLRGASETLRALE